MNRIGKRNNFPGNRHILSGIWDLVPVICFISVIWYLVSGISLHAAFEFKESGARGAALAGAYTAAADDAEAIWWNPAGLRLCRGIQAGSVYTGLYGMEDLGYTDFTFVLPTINAGTWGFGYSSFGPSDYRETDIRFSFAAELASGMYFGSNLKKNTVSVSGGGEANSYGVDAGVTSNISEKLRMGVSVINVNSPNLGDTTEAIDRRFMFGLLVKPYEGLRGSLDLHKPLEEDLEMRLGLEFVLSKILALRAGAQTIPTRFTFGFGLGWSVFSLDYAFLTHTMLASQHMIALNMRLGEAPRESAKYDENEEAKKYIRTVDINTADVERLTTLPGVNTILAKKIIEYREKTGNFKSVDELMNIYGFKKSTFDKIKDYVVIEERPVPAERSYTEEEPAREEPAEESRPEPVKIEKAPAVAPVPAVPPERYPEEDAEEPVQPEPGEPEDEPAPPAGKINLNTADARQLSNVKGVPSALAGRIVRYRDQKGKFTSWYDVMKVPGMNGKILEKLRGQCTLE
ncbi:MAG: helix-hairpin-helix domain-containing protein [Elusimicrobia bacterium]|nr:helix-hairpin-helix domain-containing protein [Elusimicrobiota bacterium]